MIADTDIIINAADVNDESSMKNPRKNNPSDPTSIVA